MAQPRLFISYSWVDRWLAEQVAKRLKRAYDHVWLDESLHGGEIWWAEILKQIDACDIFIYLMSRDSIESPYCQAEYAEAQRLHKQILPVLIRARTTIPDSLAKIQYVDVSSGLNVRGINELQASVVRLSDKLPPVPPLPATPQPQPMPTVTDKPKTLLAKFALAMRRPEWQGIGVIVAAILGILTLVIALNAALPPSSTATAIHTTAVTRTATLTPTEEPNPETLAAIAVATKTANAIAIFTKTQTEMLTATPTEAPTHTDTPTDTPTPTNTPMAILMFTPTHTAARAPMASPTLLPVASANAQRILAEQTFDGVAMVLVPRGCFMMLADGKGGKQCFDKPFWIDKYEVTNGQFARLGGQAVGLSYWMGDNRPREQITWFEARNFCAKRGARLPTEAEWEYAARGPDGLVYPWGNVFVGKNVVYDGNSGNQTADVGSKPGGASWVGALDMSGNVHEWVSSLSRHYDDYPYDAADGRESESDTSSLRGQRGGSWRDGGDNVRAGINDWGFPDGWGNTLGFRCSRTFSGEVAAIAGPTETATPEPPATFFPTVTANGQWRPVEQTFNGVVMVLVPPGCFMMGSEKSNRDEMPVTKTCFDMPFWIDKTEVTNRQDRSGWASIIDYNRPRTGITWFEARDFCKRREARLPSEAEWEYAARGPDGLVYPWGNAFAVDKVWYQPNAKSQAASVGSKPGGASWVGALDMSGNVWEWTNSLYWPYPYDAADGRESSSDTNHARVLRGGSWSELSPAALRAAYRYEYAPDHRYANRGFRCARAFAGEVTTVAQPTETATPEPTATPFPRVADNDQWNPVELDFDGVVMVLVPPGCFMMGSDDGESNEKPVTKICFGKPFWIDKYEVTNGQFARLGGEAANVSYWSVDNRPREQITWFEARDFCAKRGARLPTEAEWEYAARGPDGLVYPWRTEFAADNVVYAGNSGGQTADVGSKLGGISWVGALDMSGNVWEWTNSLYWPYPYDAADGRESERDTSGARVLRGGSWGDYNSQLQAAARNWLVPDVWVDSDGFRCARSF